MPGSGSARVSPSRGPWPRTGCPPSSSCGRASSSTTASRHRRRREVLVRALSGRSGQAPQGQREGDPDPRPDACGSCSGSPGPTSRPSTAPSWPARAGSCPGNTSSASARRAFARPRRRGPYKFVSFNPGVELVLEAFEGYWRKTPSIKRLVFRSLPDETTRAAALKSGEVDVAFLLSGPTADESAHAGSAPGGAASGHLLARFPRSVGCQVPVGRPARAPGRKPRHRPPGPEPGRDPGALAPDRAASSRAISSSPCPSSRTPTIPSAPSNSSPRPAIQRV